MASALTIATASLLLAGCFTVEATFTINDDATADLDYLILIDTEQLEDFAGLLGEDTSALGDLSGDALLEEFTGGDDPCSDLTAELTDYEVSTREIDENGEVGVGCTVSSIPITELSSLGDDTSSFSIEQDADGTRFDAVLEGVDELAGDPAETDAMVDLLGLDLDDLFTVRFVVSAPGSLGSNNASSTSGSTATWDVKADADFVADGDATMTAQWTPGGGDGSSSTLLIVLIVAALAAVAAIGFVLFKRTKATPETPTPPPGAPAAPTSAMAPPTMTPTATPPPPPPPASSSPPPPPSGDRPPSTPPSAPPSTPPPPPPS